MLLRIPWVRKTVHGDSAVIQGMPVVPAMTLPLLLRLPLYLPVVVLLLLPMSVPVPVPFTRRRTMWPQLPSHRMTQADSANGTAVLIGIWVPVLRRRLWL